MRLQSILGLIKTLIAVGYFEDSSMAVWFFK